MTNITKLDNWSNGPMPGKSIPLSVRLTPEDSTFLQGLSIADATTPSDKLRALIKEARHRREGVRNYAEALTFFEELLSDTAHRLREAEASQGVHSELLVQTASWLPDIMAYLMVRASEIGLETIGETIGETGGEAGGTDVEAKLKRLENGVADRVFALIQQVLRLGVTSRNPCYDSTAITSRVEPIIELSELLRIMASRKEG